MASALLNNSREVAGLLGITVIGAVLRSRQGAALSQGARPTDAFLDGYHAGLALTIVLVAAGVVISYVALRRLPALAPSPAPVAASGAAAGTGAAAGSDGRGPGPAAGPELAGRRS
jgi:Na+-transporting NADH:ubiquinone oxidoreductase subunit NqrD